MFQTTNQLLFGDSELIVFECFLHHQTVDNYFSKKIGWLVNTWYYLLFKPFKNRRKSNVRKLQIHGASWRFVLYR